MIPILIFTAVILLFVTALFTARYRRSRSVSLKRREGIKKLESFKTLLVHLQQHRGLSNGELNGDQALHHRVSTVANHIDQDWRTLESLDANLPTTDRFSGLFTHWNRLKVRYSGLSVNNNLEQHNRLILNLLYLIEDISESHHLDYIQPDTRGIEVIWKELLETAESIGQVRALGTGIVASGGCNSIQRIRVKFLNEKIQRMLSEVTQRLQHALDRGASPSLLSPLLNKVTDTERVILQLTLLNETELYKDDGITISSEAYFSLASRCLEPLLALFDEGIERLKMIV